MFNENEKITRELNEILIDRIRKYQSQDISQLLNSPTNDDMKNSYLGGLINFVGEDTIINLDEEINNDLDKISIKEIYIKPQPDNEYINELIEEDEEEKEKEEDNEMEKESNEEPKEIDSNETEKKEENSMIIPFITKTNPDSIRTLLADNLNTYFALIENNYEKYDNNHFPKIIVNENNTKKIMLTNLMNKIYYTKEGKKIIVNDEIYEASLAYLKNKEIYTNIPLRFKKSQSEFTLDFNLLDETIENIQKKSFEFIEINKLVSTSMSKITSFCSQLNKYVEEKLEPFNNSINVSYEKINHKKQIISEIKEKTLKNSGDIILKKIKMNNSIKLLNKLKKFVHIKKIMNNIDLLLLDPKNYQKTFDLINECEEEIEKIKYEDMNKTIGRELSNDSKNNIHKKNDKKLIHELKKEESKEIEIKEPIIEIFESKLIEYKNENENHMSNQLSKVLNNYFNDYIILENENEVNEEKEKMEKYEKYNISKFVLEKISSFSQKHKAILTSFSFPSPEKEFEKLNSIYDYYIESDLLNNIYIILREIFSELSKQVMNNILSIFNEKIKISSESGNTLQQDNSTSTENGTQNENKESETINNNEKDQEDNEKMAELGKDEIIYDEICALLCILLCKNRLNEDISSFIELLFKKIENNEKIKEANNEHHINEIEEIKKSIKNIIQNILITQIQKCLHVISSQNEIDLYIDNFYLTLEMLQNEIENYEIEKNNNLEDDINDNIENNNNENNLIEKNNLFKIIIEEQKYFIENWLKFNISKFDSELYKSWDILKEIPSKYQNILNLFFNYDINNNCMKDESIITQFPSDKIKLLKEVEDEEEEKTNDSNINDEKDNLLIIKDGEKPEIKIKISQISLEIIQSSFELLKMFSIFHKDCYGFILENFTKIIIYHLNFQIDQIYSGKCGFSISQQEISMTYGIFLLIEYIYEHIKNSEFFVTVAENSDQNIYDSYLDVNKNIKECCDLSKKKIEDLLDNHCVNDTLTKLQEIKLPYYNVISGDVPVNEYAIHYVSSLKDIYNSMINCYEETYIKEMMNKSLDEFFDKFEDYIFHGKKIEDEDCLKQFKRDMTFLKKNLVFIKIIDLTEIKNRIDNINKSVLPESMRPKKK
jgi:hypothetical protein